MSKDKKTGMVLGSLYCQTLGIVCDFLANLHGGGAFHDHIPVSAKLYSAMPLCGTMLPETGLLLPL